VRIVEVPVRCSGTVREQGKALEDLVQGTNNFWNKLVVGELYCMATDCTTFQNL
jgi:hypothetical protein